MRKQGFQYTLRWLLFSCVIVALPLGIFMNRLRTARRQRDAVAAVQALGGCVWYDDQCLRDQWPDEDLSLRDAGYPPAPTLLDELLGRDFCHRVIGVSFVVCDLSTGKWAAISDSDIRIALDFPGLRCLDLAGQPITDGSITSITELKRLEELYLSDTPIAELTVGMVKELPRLRILDIRGTNIAGTRARLIQEKCESVRVIRDNSNASDIKDSIRDSGIRGQSLTLDGFVTTPN